MSNHNNPRRDEQRRSEHGPRWESKDPGKGCNSTHVARSRRKWKRRTRRAARRKQNTIVPMSEVMSSSEDILKHPNDAKERSADNKHTWSWNRSGERYRYDHYLLARGWQQWDTEQDAWYFGIWVNPRTYEIFTYCEGDCIHVVCETAEAFRAELTDMARTYGEAPPAMIVLDLDNNTRTDVYSKRLTADDIA